MPSSKAGGRKPSRINRGRQPSGGGRKPSAGGKPRQPSGSKDRRSSTGARATPTAGSKAPRSSTGGRRVQPSAVSRDVPIFRFPEPPELRRWAERNGFSPHMVSRWVHLFPEGREILEGMLREVPTYLRANPLVAPARETRRRLEARGFHLAEVAGTGPLVAWRVEAAPFAPASTPEHLLGHFYIQDAASMLAPVALTPKPGERILDLAAAPGGKTTALAILAGDEAAILAVDPDARRAAAVCANLDRLNVRSVAVWVGDGTAVGGDGLEGTFDAVLLDAPCTGEGVIPRDPGRKRGDPDEYARLSALQWQLVQRAAHLLRPGGRLVYSTCTLAPEENELILERAMGIGLVPRELPFRSLNGKPLLPGLVQAGEHEFPHEVRHGVRALPHRNDTLGQFVALLEKEREPPGDGAMTGAPPTGSGSVRGLHPREEQALAAVVAAYGARPDWGGRLSVVGTRASDSGKLTIAHPGTLRAFAELGPLQVGMAMGELTKRKVRLGVEGARFLARTAKRGLLKVNDKGEQLFLYGRNVLRRSVLGRPERAEGEPWIIVNQRGEGLGLARPASGEEAARPVADRGRYLRGGMWD